MFELAERLPDQTQLRPAHLRRQGLGPSVHQAACVMIVDDDHRLMLQAPASRPEHPRIKFEPFRRTLLAVMVQISATFRPAHAVLDVLLVLSGQAGEIGQQCVFDYSGVQPLRRTGATPHVI
ncbi:hypothetical protein D3C84_897420 [compost metagenome]